MLFVDTVSLPHINLGGRSAQIPGTDWCLAAISENLE